MIAVMLSYTLLRLLVNFVTLISYWFCAIPTNIPINIKHEKNTIRARHEILPLLIELFRRPLLFDRVRLTTIDPTSSSFSFSCGDITISYVLAWRLYILYILRTILFLFRRMIIYGLWLEIFYFHFIWV